MTAIFSIERGNEITNAGGFWCEACLTGKPLDDVSPDPRYCIGCYEFLRKEAEMLPDTRRPGWIPKVPKASNQILGQGKVMIVPQVVSTIMATVNDQKSTVAIIPPVPPKVTRQKKRGPKPRKLPEWVIAKLARRGLGAKAIAAELKKRGVSIGWRTISRILSGERQLPPPIGEK